MKYVYLVLAKENKESFVYWIHGIHSSLQKAEKEAKLCNECESLKCYYYVIKEPVY